MWDFLSELLQNRKRTVTVMLMDEEYREAPRSFRVQPQKLLYVLSGAAAIFALLLTALLVLTPIRHVLPGDDGAEVAQEARLAALRLEALEDSLDVQQQYMEHLRRLLLGDVDVTEVEVAPEATAEAPSPLVYDEEQESVSEYWSDHSAPALSFRRIPVEPAPEAEQPMIPSRYVSSLMLPASPPTSGVITRGYDPRTGHYGIDFAVEEGTAVQAVGDGYVVLADWTHDGGYTIAVQHADGFVSAYKHNQRLLKRPGDRVRAQETIALSGDTGETSTGPHLHFELWQNGLAQDPQHYLVGL